MAVCEKRTLEETVHNAKNVLLDIEGTTTSISFVKDTLFPYVRKSLESYVSANWDKDEFKEVLTLLREQATTDVDSKVEGVVAIPSEGSVDVQQAAVVSNVLWQMDNDRKTTALKKLQGLVWRLGYKDGELKGHVYPDVAPALRRWTENGRKLYVYSSGSVEAQKLLFKYSQEGDLSELFSGHFDTTVGSKVEADSYKAIAKSLDCNPDNLIFLTDVPKEASAAREAGLPVVLVTREDAQELSADEKGDFSSVSSLEDVQFSTCAVKKQKVDKTEANGDAEEKNGVAAEEKMEVEETPKTEVAEKEEPKTEEAKVEEKTVSEEKVTEAKEEAVEKMEEDSETKVEEKAEEVVEKKEEAKPVEKEEVKPVEEKKEEVKPVEKEEVKPVEEKKDEEAKPVEKKDEEAKPVEKKDEEAKPVEKKGEEVKPVEKKEKEVKPVEEAKTSEETEKKVEVKETKAPVEEEKVEKTEEKEVEKVATTEEAKPVDEKVEETKTEEVKKGEEPKVEEKEEKSEEKIEEEKTVEKAEEAVEAKAEEVEKAVEAKEEKEESKKEEGETPKQNGVENGAAVNGVTNGKSENGVNGKEAEKPAEEEVKVKKGAAAAPAEAEVAAEA